MSLGQVVPKPAEGLHGFTEPHVERRRFRIGRGPRHGCLEDPGHSCASDLKGSTTFPLSTVDPPEKVQAVHGAKIVRRRQKRLKRRPAAIRKFTRSNRLTRAIGPVTAELIGKKVLDGRPDTGEVYLLTHRKLVNETFDRRQRIVEKAVIDDEGPGEIPGIALGLDDVRQPERPGPALIHPAPFDQRGSHRPGVSEGNEDARGRTEPRQGSPPERQQPA